MRAPGRAPPPSLFGNIPTTVRRAAARCCGPGADGPRAHTHGLLWAARGVRSGGAAGRARAPSAFQIGPLRGRHWARAAVSGFGRTPGGARTTPGRRRAGPLYFLKSKNLAKVPSGPRK